MITIIAEKPSVAQAIARIVGARTRKDGYMEGGGYAVTWAFGHLVEIRAEGDEDWDTPLPLLPERFTLGVGRTRRKDGKTAPDPGYAKQLGVIRYLFHHSDEVINAGDAGREGELIQRYIYAYVNGSVPVRRLWISSLTDESIREGLRSLRPSAEFDDLFLAGKARSEADWLVGVNATRALTKASGGTSLLSLGRVQTPTLALVCQRYLENRDFTPSPFWTLRAEASLGKDRFFACSGRYDNPQAALRDKEAVEASSGLLVGKVERKTVCIQPPLLHDLTSLQREANRRFGMTAQETLSAAQGLYEKKLSTYPRTGSRYIPEDVFRTLPELIRNFGDLVPGFPVASLSAGKLGRHSVSDAKVTDHHALLPTGVRPEGLSVHERKVFELICLRLLEAVSDKCEVLETEVGLTSGAVAFSLRGRTVLSPGWKAVRGEREPSTDPDGNAVQDRLPAFREGDVCRVEEVTVAEGKTRPKPLYTEGSLLEAMEHAGREVVDEGLKEALRECGLGTPATRAGEIETLVRRDYIHREGTALVPTRLGLSVYEAVKDKSIADVALTAEWERILSEIAEGRYPVEEFNKGIRQLASDIVSEIGSNAEIGRAIASSGTVSGAKCPVCGKAVLLTTRLVRCSDGGCGWRIWREIAGRTLSEREALSLLRDGATAELKGFKGRDGKPFSARLRLQDGDRVAFEFVDHSKDGKGNDILCPRCGKPVRVYPNSVVCSDESCGWKMWRTVAGKTVGDTMIPVLLSGGTTGVIRGFLSKAGKRFDASLRLNAVLALEFVFQKKQVLKKGKSSW